MNEFAFKRACVCLNNLKKGKLSMRSKQRGVRCQIHESVTTLSMSWRRGILISTFDLLLPPGVEGLNITWFN